MDIRGALQKLDPTNNDHWTAEGFPRIEALRLKGVTRADIIRAAPAFTRNNRIFTVNATDDEEDGQPADEIPAFVPQPHEEAASASDFESSEFGTGDEPDATYEAPAPGNTSYADAQALLAEATQKLQDLEAIAREANRAVVAARAERDDLLQRFGGPADSSENQRRIMAFLESTIARPGGPLPDKSPIDRAFEVRRGYGMNRPNRPVAGRG